MEPEILDLVSNDDQVIGSLDRETIYHKKLNHFRVVNAFIINSKGELWIPTRHPSKRLFPLAFDCSIGGHVKSGESYEQAFFREAEEETGINPRFHSHRMIGKLNPQDHHCSAFMHVYAIDHEGPIHYNVHDFIQFQWICPRLLFDLISKGSPAKDDLPILLKECFLCG